MANLLHSTTTLAVRTYVAAGMLCAANAHASDYQGTVSAIASLNGIAYVAMGDGAGNNGVNPCSGNIFILDPSTSDGRTMLALVIAAKATGKIIYAWGDNTCSWTPYGTPLTGQRMIGVNFTST